jgi:DNA-binding transcriptional LysR family regulator
MQLFAAVCLHGSIGKTAKMEFIAASALSKRISDLEAAIGTPLLYREARGVQLTPAGEALHRHVQAVLQDMDRMQEELQEYAQGDKGQVRLSASVAATIQFLPDELASFCDRHKDIRVKLHECLSVDVPRHVHEGSADLGICQSPLNVEGLQTKPYRRDRLVIVVAQSHPLANRDSIAFSETLEHEHIGLHDDSAISFAMRRAAFAAGRKVRTRLHVKSLEAMCRMVAAGLGVGMMPKGVFRFMSEGPSLRSVELTDAWAEREVYLVARDFSTIPIAARMLVDHILRSAKSD